jgi:hypothetical protein
MRVDSAVWSIEVIGRRMLDVSSDALPTRALAHAVASFNGSVAQQPLVRRFPTAADDPDRRWHPSLSARRVFASRRRAATDARPVDGCAHE